MMRLWILGIILVGVLACTGGGLSEEEVDSLSATAVAKALAEVPTPTPDIPATVAAGVEATMAVPPTSTPDLPATIAAAVVATMVALPTATPAPTPTPKVVVVEKEVIVEKEVVKEVEVVATPMPRLRPTLTPATPARSAPTAVPATPVSPAAVDGLVSWWPGHGNAKDIVGVNDGALMGGATFTEVALTCSLEAQLLASSTPLRASPPMPMAMSMRPIQRTTTSRRSLPLLSRPPWTPAVARRLLPEPTPSLTPTPEPHMGPSRHPSGPCSATTSGTWAGAHTRGSRCP